MADRIRDGEVVFFVGAGFSIDSEGMTAAEVVRRLVLRLHALAGMAEVAVGKRVLERFAGTFNVPETLEELGFDRKRFEAEWKLAGVQSPAPGMEERLKRLASDWHPINCLAQRYYEVNEWMCRAYGYLLASIPAGTYSEFKATLHDKEDEARKRSGWTWIQFDEVPQWLWEGVRAWKQEDGLQGPDHWWADGKLQRFGKLALMATFGFLDPATVAGCPHDVDPTPEQAGGESRALEYRVEAAYRGRLKGRHHLLARLAREGFCPSLLTTNFDLLLEGALRLSGFEREGTETGGSLPSVPVPHFDVIASPVDFYRRGKAFRTAALFKIHGCAGRVRQLGGNLKDQLKYLPQVVYTYREIQNWRADHWTADMLKTLLRTRTLVFAGYSTADPVIHDTFRSVYEEMGRRSVDHASSGAQASPAIPPAYFLGYTGAKENLEFHADEVLLSATQSVGVVSEGKEGHPHYLRFSGLNDAASKWPHLDELLGWVGHEVFRTQQAEALRSELAALIGRLDRRRPGAETERIIEQFGTLRKRERAWIEAGKDAPEARRRLALALSWSGEFHVALRREWARALVLGQVPSGGSGAGASRMGAVERLEHPLWYFPASERPSWTAWSAVVELALRRMGEVLSGAGMDDVVEPTGALRPTVFLREGSRPASPRIALTIQLRGFDRPGKRPVVPGLPARRVIWLFGEEALPWTSERTGEIQRGLPMGNDRWMVQPSPSVLWRLAGNAGGGGNDQDANASADLEAVWKALGLEGKKRKP